jgi:hypothetical protein
MADWKLGLLLPHFGQHASVEKCLGGALKAEAYGFDSVWVRDHLVFTPYDMEGTDNTHIEGLLVLSAVAAVTKKLTVGTAMTLCHRNPIHLAQCFAALSRIANGRIIMGMGLVGFPHEFAAAGLPTAPAERGAEDRETALGHVNVKSLISEANKNSTWVKPAGGIFSTLDDIRGLVLPEHRRILSAGRAPTGPPAATL